LWLIRVWFSASTFAAKIATFAKLEKGKEQIQYLLRLYWPKNRKTKWIGQQNPVKIPVKSHSQLLQATAAIVVCLPA